MTKTATIFIDDEPSSETLSPDVQSLIEETYALTCKHADLKKQIDVKKAEIISKVSAGQAVVIDGLVRMSVAGKTHWSIKDADALQKNLKSEFSDLVKTETKFKCTNALLERSKSVKTIKSLLIEKHSTTVRFTAEKLKK